MRLVRSLGIERPGQAFFFSYQEEPPPDGFFRVDTLYTGLSAGTELTFLKGTNPYLHASWDETLGVFCPGEPSIGFPVNFLGYMEVGRVTESRSPTMDVGAVIGMSYGHKTGHTSSDRDFFVPLPSDIDPILGIYVAQMGPICANGLLHAGADLLARDVQSLGDGVRERRVLITGGGVVGLLTRPVRPPSRAAAIALADPNRRRLAAARALGMDPIDNREQETWRWCKERWRNGPNDRGADVVFQCRSAGAFRPHYAACDPRAP